MIKYQPVIPSSLFQERTDNDFNYSQRISNNLTLKIGVVVEIIELEDKSNVSKITTEYNVMTIESQNNHVYKNCMSVDGFGGVADFFNKKLRATSDALKAEKRSALDKQNGSIVLLLCIDGHSEQAVIIGSIAHPDRKNGKLSTDKGHHLEGEFNGINWQIDKDGALTIKFNSATDNDGNYKDSAAGGSTFKMEKDGSIEASDGSKEKIRIDKTSKSVDVSAAKDISLTADANANIKAKSNVNIKSGASLLAEAEGSATIKTDGALNVQAEGIFKVKAASANLMIDGSMMVKATSMLLNAPSVIVGPAGTPAVVLTTQFMGIGNLGMPVISVAIGPFSNSVLISP